MKNPQDDDVLPVLLFRASLFLLIGYSVLVTIRLSVAPMHPLGAYFIVSTCAVLMTTLLLAYYRKWVRLAAYIFIGGILALVVARASVAGGSESPILIVTIIAPVAAMFLLGSTAGVVFSVVVLIIMLVFVWLGAGDREFSGLLMDRRSINIVQGTIIIFVMAICSWVAWLYARHNEGLKSVLLEQSHRDHLTGVPNRRALDIALEKEIKMARRHGHPLTVFMVDLDYFKRFNDNHGHTEGDHCLISVANIIKSCLRRPGDMIARYGGEEFVVILPDTSSSQAMQLAETMRHAVLGLAIKHKDSPVGVVSITLGITELSAGDLALPETLINQADEALYEGKAAGRNQVRIYDHNEKES